MTQTYRILYNNGDVAYFAIGSSGVFYGTAQSSLEKLTYSSHGLTWAITPFGRFQHTEPDGPEWLTLHSAKCLNSSSIKTNIKTPEEDRTVILRIIADGDTEAYLRLDMVTRRAYYGDTLQNLSACQTRWEGYSEAIRDNAPFCTPTTANYIFLKVKIWCKNLEEMTFSVN